MAHPDETSAYGDSVNTTGKTSTSGVELHSPSLCSGTSGSTESGSRTSHVKNTPAKCSSAYSPLSHSLGSSPPPHWDNSQQVKVAVAEATAAAVPTKAHAPNKATHALPNRAAHPKIKAHVAVQKTQKNATQKDVRPKQNHQADVRPKQNHQADVHHKDATAKPPMRLKTKKPSTPAHSVASKAPTQASHISNFSRLKMNDQPRLLENWIFLAGCWIFPSRLSSLRLCGSARGFEFISRAEPQSKT
jgi:hypothetical protein